MQDSERILLLRMILTSTDVKKLSYFRHRRIINKNITITFPELIFTKREATVIYSSQISIILLFWNLPAGFYKIWWLISYERYVEILRAYTTCCLRYRYDKARSSRSRCFSKKVFLNISQYSQGNTYARIFF